MRIRVRAGSDRGAVIVEAALVAPVLLLLAFAILEVGLIYRDYLTVSDATSDGARVGSIQGPDIIEGSNADHAIIARMRQDLASIDPSAVDRIVVFKAGPSSDGAPLDQVPPACKTGSSNQVEACNVYDPIEAFAAVETGDLEYFDCQTAGDVSCGWDPATRSDGPNITDIDYIGVYVAFDRQLVTGMFGSEFGFETASVLRLEPGVLG